MRKLSLFNLFGIDKAGLSGGPSFTVFSHEGAKSEATKDVFQSSGCPSRHLPHLVSGRESQSPTTRISGSDVPTEAQGGGPVKTMNFVCRPTHGTQSHAKGPHPDLAADMVGPFCERGSCSYTNCALTSALPVLCPRPRPRSPEVTAEVAPEDSTGVPQRRLIALPAYLHCECPGSLCSSQKASGICYRSVWRRGRDEVKCGVSAMSLA